LQRLSIQLRKQTMQARIEVCPPKICVGQRIQLSVNAAAKNIALWQAFAPRKKEIAQVIDPGFHSIEIYPATYFDRFDPTAEFEKWAAVEVQAITVLPSGLEAVQLPGGLYAVFLYRGDARQAFPFLQKIFTEWLPQSGYCLDTRPHFEVMGPKYKNNAEDSEEEFWIPLRRN